MKGRSWQGSTGTLLVQKRELLGWKHPRAQSFGEGRLDEEGNEGGENGAFTHICLSSLSLFDFLFFNSCIFPYDELILFYRVLDVVWLGFKYLGFDLLSI